MKAPIDTTGWPTEIAERAKETPECFAGRAEFAPGNWYIGVGFGASCRHYYADPPVDSGETVPGWGRIHWATSLCGYRIESSVVFSCDEKGPWPRCKSCERALARRT